MTDTLTDEIIEEIATVNPWSGDVVFRHGDIRAGADWQLEEVIKWLRENLGLIEPDGTISYFKSTSDDDECVVFDEWKVISDLRQAMRPQGDN